MLEVHLLSAADEPDVVEVAGVAEVEAAFLFGECGDVRAGDDREADEDEEGGGGDAGRSVALPEDAEGYERHDAEEGEEEAEGLGEIGEAEGEAHEGGVAEFCGGEVAEQSGDGEEEERLEESVGTDACPC